MKKKTNKTVVRQGHWTRGAHGFVTVSEASIILRRPVMFIQRDIRAGILPARAAEVRRWQARHEPDFPRRPRTLPAAG